MKELFFPTIPYFIPHSAGLAHWWDIFWWVFQIVVMSTLVLVFRKWAIGFDREQEAGMTQGTSTSAKVPPQSPGIPG